jgi:ferrous iron transport protein A
MRELTKLLNNEEAPVTALKGGRGFTGRMASMGLTVGVRVKMLQNFGRGSLIILVRDTRIALGRGEASKILIGGSTGDK